MNWPNWVLDATQWNDAPGVMCFVPYEDDGTLVVGMNMITGKCPGKFVGVIHADGDAAAEAWCGVHQDVIDQLIAERPSE